jgi:hypothetical protein
MDERLEARPAYWCRAPPRTPGIELNALMDRILAGMDVCSSGGARYP